MKGLVESIISSNNAGIYPNKDYKEFIEIWSDPKLVGKYKDQIYKNYIDTQYGWAESFWSMYMEDKHGQPHMDELKEIEQNLKKIFDALPDWKCLDKFWWFNEKVIKKNGLTVQDLIDGIKKEIGSDVKKMISDRSLR